jgi:hypothetical protein
MDITAKSDGWASVYALWHSRCMCSSPRSETYGNIYSTRVADALMNTYVSYNGRVARTQNTLGTQTHHTHIHTHTHTHPLTLPRARTHTFTHIHVITHTPHNTQSHMVTTIPTDTHIHRTRRTHTPSYIVQSLKHVTTTHRCRSHSRSIRSPTVSSSTTVTTRTIRLRDQLLSYRATTQ